MGLLSDYNAKFASRLELLRAGMEEVMAQAHRELESFNEDFIGIYNELHKTLHADGEAEAPTKSKGVETADRPSGLPKIDLTEFERAIIEVGHSGFVIGLDAPATPKATS